jgi:DNA-binding NtrC family response regulator
VRQDSTQAAGGEEVLVVDKDEKVARGMQTLLGRLGLVVTLTSDSVRARDLLVTKFFAVALLDVDTPNTGQGLELLKFAREKSPLTTIIMMTARKAFDIGVAGFRGGAADVVVKEPDTVPYLKDRVLAAARQLMALSDRTTLLDEVADAHEEFLRRMRDRPLGELTGCRRYESVLRRARLNLDGYVAAACEEQALALGSSQQELPLVIR